MVGDYVINLDEYCNIGTHCAALYMQNNNNNNKNVIYLNDFGVEHIPKEIKAFINHLWFSASQNKNIKTNIFRIQT